MIVCFNCSTETKATLDSVIQSGQYKDYSQAISLAIMNLAVLQEEVLKSGGMVIGAGTDTGLRVSENPMQYSVQSPSTPLQQLGLRTGGAIIPKLFRLDGLPDSPPSLADVPDDIWTIGQEIAIDRWVFGQYNRLLPAKASCRALAHLLLGQPKGILLEDVAHRIAKEAAVLGDLLANHDDENDIARDDALSTAFPSTGRKSDKSRLRYANQFVASVNRQGQVSGLLMDLKLINTKGRQATRVMLTEVGWQLATMLNPILDSLQDRPTQKFSEHERCLLLTHIARSVPVEDFAYRAILRAILTGQNTPDAVDTALMENVPQGANRGLSKSFLSSQRSGAISRMTDLALVERVRDGVRVSYVVTDAGNKYVQNAYRLG